MTGSVKTLDTRGHSTIEFDTDNEAQLAAAVDAVYAASRNRFAVFDASTKERIGSETPSKPMSRKGAEQLVREHPNTLVIPPMAGG